MTSVRSILDKPLSQLTEDDISQVTREDCRKFLKDKGMRRPSWNKSQAIQQVICLKALLEGGDDDDSSARNNLRKIVVSAAVAADENPQRANSNSGDSGKELSAAVNVSESAEEVVPHLQREFPESMPHDAPTSPVNTNMRAPSLRLGSAPEYADMEGQMNRKVLLQRYLEKRKDRGKFKVRKDVSPVSSNLEIYMNQPTRTPALNGQFRKSSSRTSPPQPVSFSVDLNEGV